MDTPAAPAPSLTEGRLCVLLAALLWSMSGLFKSLLTYETPLGVHEPPVSPVQMAFYRAFFAGLLFLPTIRRADISFRPMMLVMVVSFAIMNGTFVFALAQGKAANAILLQYTAPMWMYVAAVCWLGEPVERRGTIALGISLLGIAAILVGGWQDEDVLVLVLALISGLGYAGVLLCLRVLRASSSRWLTLLNHLGGALVLLPLLLPPEEMSWPQLGLMALFGGLQMGLPYFLIARGLRSVSAQEAGMICLLEPILNPCWACLVSERELPSNATFFGGALILGALAWRYWPRRTAGQG